MCAADKCRKYDTCWTCPPACGSIEECTQRTARYSYGIIVQTTKKLEDSLDYEEIMAIQKLHNTAFEKFAESLRREFPGLLALGSGGCKLCDACTYPAGPCRFPYRALSSMEAYGILVSELCKANGIPYYYGPGTMTFVGCFLWREEKKHLKICRACLCGIGCIPCKRPRFCCKIVLVFNFAIVFKNITSPSVFRK
jgi:predicted metal-binding protein